MQNLIVLVIVGFVAQLVDGALGMAYGATSATLVLAAGYAPATASASVHLAELGTTAVSGYSHWRFGNVDWRTARRIGIPGAIGAFLGAVVLSSISAEVAKPWMAGILLVLGAYLLVRFTLLGLPQPREDEPCAAHAERMPEGDRPAVHVHALLVEAELANDDEALRGECLVQLDEVDLTGGDARPVEE